MSDVWFGYNRKLNRNGWTLGFPPEKKLRMNDTFVPFPYADDGNVYVIDKQYRRGSSRYNDIPIVSSVRNGTWYSGDQIAEYQKLYEQNEGYLKPPEQVTEDLIQKEKMKKKALYKQAMEQVLRPEVVQQIDKESQRPGEGATPSRTNPQVVVVDDDRRKVVSPQKDSDVEQMKQQQQQQQQQPQSGSTEQPDWGSRAQFLSIALFGDDKRTSYLKLRKLISFAESWRGRKEELKGLFMDDYKNVEEFLYNPFRINAEATIKDKSLLRLVDAGDTVRTGITRLVDVLTNDEDVIDVFMPVQNGVYVFDYPVRVFAKIGSFEKMYKDLYEYFPSTKIDTFMASYALFLDLSGVQDDWFIERMKKILQIPNFELNNPEGLYCYKSIWKMLEQLGEDHDFFYLKENAIYQCIQDSFDYCHLYLTTLADFAEVLRDLGRKVVELLNKPEAKARKAQISHYRHLLRKALYRAIFPALVTTDQKANGLLAIHRPVDGTIETRVLMHDALSDLSVYYGLLTDIVNVLNPSDQAAETAAIEEEADRKEEEEEQAEGTEEGAEEGESTAGKGWEDDDSRHLKRMMRKENLVREQRKQAEILRHYLNGVNAQDLLKAGADRPYPI